MTFYALHGFLGLPSDWSFIPEANALNLFAPGSLRHDDFDSWAKWWNAETSSKNPKILMGYSLGGRLALHALKENPGNWTAAVIISANPGLKTMSDKERRMQNDLLWSKKFLSDPWEQLISDWNGQPIFKDDMFHPVRKERDFNRSSLAKALAQWSLAKQENLRSSIARLPLPVLWISPEPVELSHPDSKFWIAHQGGHRLIWTHQELLLEKIMKFKESI